MEVDDHDGAFSLLNSGEGAHAAEVPKLGAEGGSELRVVVLDDYRIRQDKKTKSHEETQESVRV